MRIAVIGSGYVGLVTAACFAKLGHKVFCVDHDSEKVRKINERIAPFKEKGLPQLLSEVAGTNLFATTDLPEAMKGSDIIFICVGTPSRKDGSIDLTAVKGAAADIAKNLRSGQSIVVKSTVLPGSTESLVLILQKSKKNFKLFTNPEFLREGKAIEDFMNPNRVVVGYSGDTEPLFSLYSNFNCPKLFVDWRTAEMIKYASNAFLATKISFINEIGNLCKVLGVDTYRVAEGMGLDQRIGQHFLRPGIGFGGSCFEKDLSALIDFSNEKGVKPRILESVVAVNDEQPLKFVKLVEKRVGKLKGRKIGVLGLAFNPGTDDIRESRALIVVGELLKKGARVFAHDPAAMEAAKRLYPKVTYTDSADAVVKESEAILILTDWPEFAKLDTRGKLVMEGRRMDKGEGICW